jgi:hypothetical protein
MGHFSSNKCNHTREDFDLEFIDKPRYVLDIYSDETRLEILGCNFLKKVSLKLVECQRRRGPQDADP